MQPNQWQQQYPYNGSFQPQPTGYQNGMPNANNFLSSQPTGFQMQQQQPQQQQPMQTGNFNQQRPPSNPQAGGYGFLNQPPQQSSFRPSGLAPQMTGFPGGGASGLLPQQTGYPGGMMSQPTGMMGGGMMSQPTGMGLRPQPTGMHDPRLQSMMQSFMPSNLSQVRAVSRLDLLHAPS